MKLAKIAALCKASKRLLIIKDDRGRQWFSNGYALYLIDGITKITPEMALTLFDVEQEKRGAWTFKEIPTPPVDLADTCDTERELKRNPVQIVHDGRLLTLFTDYTFGRNRLLIVDTEYFKPIIMGEYTGFYAREFEGGPTVLTVKAGFEVKAVVMPVVYYSDKALNNGGELRRALKEISELFELSLEESPKVKIIDFEESEGGE